jgi:hypothetical protein
LRPESPRAALRSLAGGLPQLRFAPCSRAFWPQRGLLTQGEQTLAHPAQLLHQRVLDGLDADAADDARDEAGVRVQRRRLGEEGLEVDGKVDLPLQARRVITRQPADDGVDLGLRAAFCTYIG